ncbi:MAG: BMP family ABC transporter substrate-binding protein, partial [Candidatus Limnocylindrales bacterium]
MHLRRFARSVAMTTGLLVLTGCVASPPAPSSVGPQRVHRIAIAYDISGRGDGGFNDIAYAGAKQAADELGVELKEVTAKLDDTDDDRAERLRLLAGAGFDAIIGVGFTYAGPMQLVAAEFPDARFAIVDDGTVEAPNVYDIVFAEEEGSFLVGAAAGLTTSTGRVGFIGAVQIPLIQKFEAGFVAGVQAANPGAAVQSTYLSQPPDYSGFGDPPHGREAALGMYDNGVDVIFAAAGGSGAGVHEAASMAGH